LSWGRYSTTGAPAPAAAAVTEFWYSQSRSIAIPNLHTATSGLGWNPAQVIEANFSTGFATLYLFVVSAAIFVCYLSILASTIRLCFGMARDNQLPISGPLARVSPSLHTPVWTCIVLAVLAALPFIKYAGVAIIAIAATGMIYLSYFLGNIVIMRARVRGWPKVSAPFRLGRWGMLVNVVALLYGGAMLVNFAWPRVASNPEPRQTGGLLSLGLGFLRTKTFAAVTAPSPDDVIAPAGGAGSTPQPDG
jgi:amino acid transporter